MSADNIILNEAGGTDVPVVSADCRVLRLFVLIIGSGFYMYESFQIYELNLSFATNSWIIMQKTFVLPACHKMDRQKMPDMVN